MNLFVSWSGGKDSALAAYRARRQGHRLAYLLNCAAEDGRRVRAHGFPAQVVALQARAMDIPLVQVYTSWAEYELHFKDALRTLKASGIEGGVFGDMDLEEHREWVERVCGEVGLRPLSAAECRPTRLRFAASLTTNAWMFVVRHEAQRSAVQRDSASLRR